MSILRGLRYPTALAFGLLLTAALFWSLWSFTNVMFELNAVRAVTITFSPTFMDTPTETKSPVEEIQKPPVVERIPRGPIIEGPVVNVVPVFVPAPIDTGNIGNSGLVFSRDGDVTPLVRINPAYPIRAAQRGIEGWVQVQFTITGTGSVTDVIVVDSSPPNVFDEAAVDAISRWRYNPKVEGAVAVDRVGVQTLLRFDLEEE
jgi:protein TonB